MTRRQRRMVLVLGIVGGVSIAGALALSAFRQNVTFFFDPTQVAAGQVPAVISQAMSPVYQPSNPTGPDGRRAVGPRGCTLGMAMASAPAKPVQVACAVGRKATKSASCAARIGAKPKSSGAVTT